MKRKILIVDDQKLNRVILKKILESEYEVVEAEDGIEAIKILNENKTSFCAMILDIIMPQLDGYGVLRELRRDDELKYLPVIVATQNEGDEAELKALTIGASDFVSKPYKAKIIKHRLANLIRMREATQTVSIVERDTMTGLLNVEAFYHKVPALFRENPDVLFDMIEVDVKNFKLINDAYGMQEGNKVICYLAESVQLFCDSKRGLCAHNGADRFLMAIERSEGYVYEMQDSIISRMNRYPLDMKIHVKFGIYEIQDKTVPVISLCDRAMLATMIAKEKYEQCFAYYDESIREKLLLEQKITDEMENALIEEQFQVYFQPKYDLFTREMAGAEALVRWIHPKMGFMSPGDFIPIFEKNGFITELDMYVWEKTCEYISNWMKKGEKVVPISVNVSRKDIYRPGLPKLLSDMVHQYGMSPKMLHLEITESAYTENTDQLIEVVEQLKKMGFTIEMDDFGSGYSSLNMLANLPIDILKLDMRFIQNESEMKNTKNIMNFVIGLAKWMNLYVIAEGVETQEQLDMLKSMDCNYVQGYFFAKPMPVEEFAEMMRNSEISFIPDGDENPEDISIVGKSEENDFTMLIVDDLAMNRAILTEYFKHSFKVVEASNGKAALNYIREQGGRVDIIMLDIYMPVMDGYEFLEEIKGDSDTKDIPVIVTSQAGEEGCEKVLKMGAAAYLSKPYTIEAALQKVNHVLMETKHRVLQEEHELLMTMIEMQKKKIG